MASEVLLINPPCGRSVGILTEHLGLAYIASSLQKANITVELLDAYIDNLDLENLLQHLQGIASHPFLVGFTVINKQAWLSVYKISQYIRKIWPHSCIVLGGYFATFWYDKLLEYEEIDIVAKGESEITIVELFHCIQEKKDWETVQGIAYRNSANHIVSTPPRPLIPTLDTIAFPSRPHLKKIIACGGTPTIYGSRGCYYQCSFCQVSQFYRRQSGHVYRYRSIDNILGELKQILAHSDACSISFTDDEFIGNTKHEKKRIRQLGEQILLHQLNISFGFQCRASSVEKGLFAFLKETGLKVISIGLESLVQRSLDLFNKHISIRQNTHAIEILEDLELDYSIGFILYDPYTTIDELQQNVNSLSKLPCFPQSLTGLGVLRGTPLEKHFREAGLLVERNMSLEVLPINSDMRTIHYLLQKYSQIYLASTNNLIDTWMLLLGQRKEPERFRYQLSQARKQLKRLHLYFLNEAIHLAKKNNADDGIGLICEMEKEFAIFTPQTQLLLENTETAIYPQHSKT